MMRPSKLRIALAPVLAMAVPAPRAAASDVWKIAMGFASSRDPENLSKFVSIPDLKRSPQTLSLFLFAFPVFLFCLFLISFFYYFWRETRKVSYHLTSFGYLCPSGSKWWLKVMRSEPLTSHAWFMKPFLPPCPSLRRFPRFQFIPLICTICYLRASWIPTFLSTFALPWA